MTVPVLGGVASAGVTAGLPALVLGQSLGTSTILWDRVIPLLRDHFTILSVDLPGHGQSPPATEPFSIAELADAVVATADAAGLGSFFYAGVSLGGQVALELALLHPQRLDGVSIICSAAAIGSPEGWSERAATVRASGTAVMVEGSALRWFAKGFIEEQPEHAGALLNSLVHTDDNSYALCCEALAASDIRQRLGEITVPTLALWGSDDAVITPEQARLVSDSVVTGRGIEIAGAAHLAPIEKPDEVAAALLDFFLNNTSRRA